MIGGRRQTGSGLLGHPPVTPSVGSPSADHGALAANRERRRCSTRRLARVGRHSRPAPDSVPAVGSSENGGGDGITNADSSPGTKPSATYTNPSATCTTSTRRVAWPRARGRTKRAGKVESIANGTEVVRTERPNAYLDDRTRQARSEQSAVTLRVASERNGKSKDRSYLR